MADPFLGEIRTFAGTFAPRGWAFCQGQLLAISSNTALSGIADSNIASGIVSGSDPVSYTDIANESFAVFCRCKGGSTFFKCDRTGFTGTRF